MKTQIKSIDLTAVRFKASTPTSIVRKAQAAIAAQCQILTEKLQTAVPETEIHIDEEFYLIVRPSFDKRVENLGYQQVNIGIITTDRPLFNSIGCASMMRVED